MARRNVLLVWTARLLLGREMALRGASACGVPPGLASVVYRVDCYPV